MSISSCLLSSLCQCFTISSALLSLCETLWIYLIITPVLVSVGSCSGEGSVEGWVHAEAELKVNLWFKKKSLFPRNNKHTFNHMKIKAPLLTWRLRWTINFLNLLHLWEGCKFTVQLRKWFTDWRRVLLKDLITLPSKKPLWVDTRALSSASAEQQHSVSNEQHNSLLTHIHTASYSCFFPWHPFISKHYWNTA